MPLPLTFGTATVNGPVLRSIGKDRRTVVRLPLLFPSEKPEGGSGDECAIMGIMFDRAATDVIDADFQVGDEVYVAGRIKTDQPVSPDGELNVQVLMLDVVSDLVAERIPHWKA